MKPLFIIPFLLLSYLASAQTKQWSEADRQYQLQNFKRTRDSLIKETAALTDKQWHFKESPERWSIAEIVEHLALWEVLFAREANIALRNNPDPEMIKMSRPDSSYLHFIMEEKLHNSPDYSRPTGFISGKNNLHFFLQRNAQTINFVESTDADLKIYYEPIGGGQFRNVHQTFLVQWGHVDRHLKQIRKVKTHPAFPENN